MSYYNCGCSGPEECAVCAGYEVPDDDYEPDDDFDEEAAIQRAEIRYEKFLDNMWP